jgi:glycosyltransferase involved in cell wall biosynthesis
MTNNLSDKKILYIVKTMDIGGAEKFTLNLCEYFSNIFSEVSVASSGGIFETKLAEFGVKHFLINPEFFRLSNSFKLYNSLKEIISKNSFDLIHVQHRLPLFPLQFLKPKAKIIYTANNEFDDWFQKLLRPHAAIGISDKIEKNLRKTLTISFEKIIRIKYGVKIAQIDNSEKNNEEFVIGFIGRVIKEKGIYELIDSFEKLSKKYSKIKLVIRGNGKEMASVCGEIEQKNLNKKIIVEQNIINENSLYNSLDLLVLPTKMNEGLPISVLEAAARGLPSLCSYSGAITDFIEDNKTGFMIDNIDIYKLSEKIEEIYLNKDKMKTIGEAALKKVREEFSIEEMLKKYIEFYSKIL